MTNTAPRPTSHGTGINCPSRLAAASRSRRATVRSRSASCSPDAIRRRSEAVRSPACAIASAMVTPPRAAPAPLMEPFDSASERRTSASPRFASVTLREAREQSRARARSGPNDWANPSGSSTSGSDASDPSSTAATGTTRDRPAMPTCSPNRRAASRAWASARETSACSRSSRGSSSQSAATTVRFFQTADSAGSSFNWRASFARRFFRLRASRSSFRSLRRPLRQASRSGCTSGAASSAASFSAVARQAACRPSRGSTPRTTSSTCTASATRSSMA